MGSTIIETLEALKFRIQLGHLSEMEVIKILDQVIGRSCAVTTKPALEAAFKRNLAQSSCSLPLPMSTREQDFLARRLAAVAPIALPSRQEAVALAHALQDISESLADSSHPGRFKNAAEASQWYAAIKVKEVEVHAQAILDASREFRGV